MAKSKKPRKKYNPLKHAIREGNITTRVACQNSSDLFDQEACNTVIDDLRRAVEGLLKNDKESSGWLYLLYRRTLLLSCIAKRTITDVQYGGNEQLEILMKLELNEIIANLNDNVIPWLDKLFHAHHETGDIIIDDNTHLDKIIQYSEYILPKATLASVTRSALDVEKHFEKVVHKMKDKQRDFYIDQSLAFCEMCRYVYPHAHFQYNYGKWKAYKE